MNIEEEIAAKIREVYDPWDSNPEKIAARLVPLVEHARERAFEAGWKSSGEGYNGEHPDEGVPWEASAGREAYERWMEAPDV